MRIAPSHFIETQGRARRRWEQLEKDPELAGPWHQLFKQVQSPRHVVSELLQNADDAGATEAVVRIDDGTFIFEHNGEDFTAEHFGSLCRFGYSNKRSLHTIGFRGIGFKSTFSLGDRVELHTPSLTVGFDRVRFTEPIWLEGAEPTKGLTRIRVEIATPLLQREVQKNLDDWLRSPASLLFFKHIRRLQVGNASVEWVSHGEGPVQGSQWYELSNEKQRHLVVRSEEEAFPADALEEIRQERMLGHGEEPDFPPCRVELVLGLPGRLFVVLPTGVETKLPFACNAPFIQDPARLKVKDPETSPTNRWLLERVGRTAASAMLAWLAQEHLPGRERAAAYSLLSDVDRTDNSLEGSCTTTVESSLDKAIGGKPSVLTENGGVVCGTEAIAVPGVLLDVWDPDQVSSVFDAKNGPILSRSISAGDRAKLLNWNLVRNLTKEDVLTRLYRQRIPAPDGWLRLERLWSFVAGEVAGYTYRHDVAAMRIVPVQGQDTLAASHSVVRIGEKRLLASEEDWGFLAAHIVVLNTDWPRYLGDRVAKSDPGSTASPDAAAELLKLIRLDQASDTGVLVARVASRLSAMPETSAGQWVRLAHIAAKLGASVDDSFCFVTRDGSLRTTKQHAVLFDSDGTLEGLIPPSQREGTLLHPCYSTDLVSCSLDEWKQWAGSPRSSLSGFVPFTSARSWIWGRDELRQEARRRGASAPPYFPYVSHDFFIVDVDFSKECWAHWQTLAEQDAGTWRRVAAKALSHRDSKPSTIKKAVISQRATNGSVRELIECTPNWVLRLAALPCLPDTRGFSRLPSELLRRTPETESFIDVEPFVHSSMDTERLRPVLDLLGVRSTPTGPKLLLERLRALSGASDAPLAEVDKWYRRLDHLLDSASTTTVQEIRDAFQREKLVLTSAGQWLVSGAVFLAGSGDDVPDAPVVRAAGADLALWRRLGVADRPSVDLMLRWLNGLASGSALAADDAKRVRSLLARFPERVWRECGHWMNLSGHWVPTSGLTYKLTLQPMVAWAHLYPAIKAKTADMQGLSQAVAASETFLHLATLASKVQERLREHPQHSEPSVEKPWLTALGSGLRRLKGDHGEERTRALADTLVKTRWQATPAIEIVPFIDDTPAGTSLKADVLWVGELLYVTPMKGARLARVVPEELGRQFDRADVRAAIGYAFDRTRQQVNEYLEENFDLEPTTDDEDTKTAHDSPEPDSEDAGVGVAASGMSDGGPADRGPLEDDPDPEDPDESKEPDSEPRAKRRMKTPVIERFARVNGFHKEHDTRFVRDGECIVRVEGTFRWELRSANGVTIRRFWPKDHCLEREPLAVDAAAWDLLLAAPDKHSLVLVSPDNRPVELTGTDLKARTAEGLITLYPAAYRLKYGA